MAYDPSGNRLLVAGMEQNAVSTIILEVDLDTGDRRALFSGSGLYFRSVALDPAANRAWGVVVTFSAGVEAVSEVWLVDLETGEASQEMNGDRSDFEALRWAGAPRVFGDRVWFLSREAGPGAVGVNNAPSEARYVVYDRSEAALTVPAAEELERGALWAVGPDQQRAFIVDAELFAPRLLSADLTTGDATRLDASQRGVGSPGAGPRLRNVQDVDIEVGTNRALMTQIETYATGSTTTVMRVDLEDGGRSIVSGAGVGSGPAMGRAGDIRVLPSGEAALVVDTVAKRLVSVDLSTGARTYVDQSGPEILQPLAMALSRDGREAYVLDVSTLLRQGVVAVDLSTGERRIVSQRGTGTGPDLTGAKAITPGRDETEVLVVLNQSAGQPASWSIVSVDLQTGDRTLLFERPEAGLFAVVTDAHSEDPGTLLVATYRALNSDGFIFPTNRIGLVEVDLTTFEATDRLDPDRGPTPFSITGLGYDGELRRAFLVDPSSGLQVLDFATGERVQASH